MIYRIKLFSLVKEVVGTGSIAIDLPAGLSSTEFIDRFCQAYPELKQHQSRLRLACDHQYMSDREIIGDDVKEIAIFPPVSGG